MKKYKVIRVVDNVYLYEIIGNNIGGYIIITLWSSFFIFDYQEALNKFNDCVEDLK